MSYYDVIDTPIGRLFVGGSARGIHRVDFIDDDRETRGEAGRVALLERESGEPATRDDEATTFATSQQRSLTDRMKSVLASSSRNCTRSFLSDADRFASNSNLRAALR